GPAALFSFTIGVMYLFMAHRFGRLAAAAAAGSWLLMPRVFAHAHLASYDIPLACLWFLAVVAFWKAREKWHESFHAGTMWSVIFASALAMAAATKFTGWLIPVPLLLWTAGSMVSQLSRDWSALRASAVMLSRLGVLLMGLLAIVPIEFQLLREIRRTEAAM